MTYIINQDGEREAYDRQVTANIEAVLKTCTRCPKTHTWSVRAADRIRQRNKRSIGRYGLVKVSLDHSDAVTVAVYMVGHDDYLKTFPLSHGGA